MSDYLLIGGPWHGRVKTVPDNLRTFYVYQQTITRFDFTAGNVKVADPNVAKHEYELHIGQGRMMPVDADFQGYGIYQGIRK